MKLKMVYFKWGPPLFGRAATPPQDTGPTQPQTWHQIYYVYLCILCMCLSHELDIWVWSLTEPEVLRDQDGFSHSRQDVISSIPHPWDTHYQFSIKTLLANKESCLRTPYKSKGNQKIDVGETQACPQNWLHVEYVCVRVCLSAWQCWSRARVWGALLK